MDTLYDPYQQWESILAIYHNPIDSNYYCLGKTNDNYATDSNWYRRIFILKLNPKGQILKQRLIGKNYYNYDAVASSFDKDARFIIRINDTNSVKEKRNYMYYLASINTDLDTALQLIGFPYSHAAIQFNSRTQDNHFLIVGNESWLTTANAFVSKIDTLGNIKWLTNLSFQVSVWGIVQTPDKGFVLSGFKGFDNNARMWIGKIDSMGNLGWQTDFTDSRYYSSIFQYSILHNEYLFLCGVVGNSLYLLKTDVDGNKIWEKYYPVGSNGHRGFQTINTTTGFVKIIARNDNLYLSAWVDTVLGDIGETRVGYVGALFKIDTTGDIKWMQMYHRYFSGNSNENLYSTPDGFLMCGSAIDTTHLAGFADGWFLKTDTNGCIIPGCPLTKPSLNYVHSILIDNEMIEVYPNPAKDILNIQLKSILKDLDCKIGIYSAEGRIIYEDSCKSDLIQINLKALNIVSGFYWLLMQDHNTNYYKRFLITN